MFRFFSFLLSFFIFTQSVFADVVSDSSFYSVSNTTSSSLSLNDKYARFAVVAVPIGQFILQGLIGTVIFHSVINELVDSANVLFNSKAKELQNAKTVEEVVALGVPEYSARKIDDLLNSQSSSDSIHISLEDYKDIDVPSIAMNLDILGSSSEYPVIAGSVSYESADFDSKVKEHDYYIFSSTPYYNMFFFKDVKLSSSSSLSFSYSSMIKASKVSYHANYPKNMIEIRNYNVSGVLNPSLNNIIATNIPFLESYASNNASDLAHMGYVYSYDVGSVDYADFYNHYPKDGITIKKDYFGTVVDVGTFDGLMDSIDSAVLTGDIVFNGESVKVDDVVINPPIDSPIDIPILGDILGVLNDIWTSIKSGFSSVVSSIDSTIDSIVSIPNKIIEFFYASPTLSIDFSPLQISLLDKFPFSLPFDLFNTFKSFLAEKEVPNFKISFDEGLVGSATFELDFTPFSKLAAILRYFILIYFLVNLIKLTRNIIGG